MSYACEGTRLPTSHAHALARARAHTHHQIHARTPACRHVCTPTARLNQSRAPIIVSLTSKAEMMVPVRVSRRSVLSHERSPCREPGSSVQACRCRRKNLPRRREEDATPNRLRLIPNIRVFWYVSSYKILWLRSRTKFVSASLCSVRQNSHRTSSVGKPCPS
jgi:hypothetical protein